MKLLHDYFYHFRRAPLHLPGRCRVRIYQGLRGAHTVLLTELETNAGESIAGASDRIATELVAIRGLNPTTTRWIHHETPHSGQPHTFDDLQFTWDGNRTAHTPQWRPLSDDQAIAWTGESLHALNRRLGDLDDSMEEESEHDETEAQGAA